MSNAFASDPSGNIPGVQFNADLSNWNVSNVTDMFGMFGACSVFNQDLSSWNVSNVTDMRLMFLDCSVFNQDLSNWSFTTTPEHADWCTGAPICNDQTKWPPQLRTGTGYMFLDCSVFNQDLSSWSFTTTPEHTSPTRISKKIMLSSDIYYLGTGVLFRFIRETSQCLEL